MKDPQATEYIARWDIRPLVSKRFVDKLAQTFVNAGAIFIYVD